MMEIKMEKAALVKNPEEIESLVLNGHSSVLKIQGRKTGRVTINGNNTCIYLDGDLEQQNEQHITYNDLIYQLVEVLELLIILLIFYVIFNNIGY